MEGKVSVVVKYITIVVLFQLSMTMREATKGQRQGTTYC
jgi:hypothetical protein